MTATRTIVAVASALTMLAASRPADAQSLGTFRWQLQPFCNVITVNVTQSGAVYTLDGYDDQCGAPTRAALVGLATPNPDGTIGFGLQLVTTPSATPVAVRASITLAALGGAWSDSAGNSGTMVFNGAAAGSPRPATSGVTASAVNVTGTVTAAAANVSGAVTAASADVGRLMATSLDTPAIRTFGATDVNIVGSLRVGQNLFVDDGTLLLQNVGFQTGILMTRVNGTASTPLQVATGNELGFVSFRGRTASGFSADAGIRSFATENWLSSTGRSLAFETVPNGSTAPARRLFIDHNGEVGIGTQTPDQLLSVNGNASKVGGGSWAVFSDERLKTVHGPFTRGLADVLRLRPIRFEYRADNPLGLRGQGEYVGFSAQAVKDVIPEAVSVSESGFLQLQGDPLLWAMLNAIKELEAEIRELRRTAAARDR
ncbi:MAG: tail fiber domain-containing protein [Acidobacteria bacterium]|nr:tail fiber domain-containing protein [Acidobacteriota bacterium]